MRIHESCLGGRRARAGAVARCTRGSLHVACGRRARVYCRSVVVRRFGCVVGGGVRCAHTVVAPHMSTSGEEAKRQYVQGLTFPITSCTLSNQGKWLRSDCL
jgi:hypothetical protein